jgi:glycosyltransferase involved in cell wall biosynthesis
MSNSSEPSCTLEKKPKATIGVCVKNSAATISETIKSISLQDFPVDQMELIIVDGYSRDDTLSIVKRTLQSGDIRTKIFQENKGLGTARQTVVDNADGEYIIWVDGDNLLPKDHVRKQIEFMEQNPNVGIGKARCGLSYGESTVATLENIPFVLYDAKDGPTVSSPPATAGSIYRVKAIKQVGGFDCGMKGAGEDQDAAYRVRATGWAIKRSPTTYYERRVKTVKTLWDKYFWYGQGGYDLYRRHRRIFSLFRMNPIAGFVVGVLYTPRVYSLTERKSAFLLPLHCAFKSTAWCLGFTKAQITH